MTVTLEHLGPCKKLLRVEVETAAVDSAFEEITKDFLKHARLPGFRSGKAPRHLIAKAFESQIQAEVRRKLISDHFHKAIEEQKLHVVGQPDIEEIEFTKGQPLHFAATVETAPEFELPEYRGLPLQREIRSVTEEDVERAVGLLREQRASYLDVSRPTQSGDFVVVHYTGTCEGKPITDWAPTARGLTEKKDFWIEIKPDAFIPGFAEQLIGASAGDRRTVQVQFPTDFVAPEVAGKAGVYEVEVVQVKEKAMPEVTDEFAQGYGAQTVDILRAGVRRDLEGELSYKIKRTSRGQLVKELLQRVQCDLPESIVSRETRNVVYDVVRENTERGIPREAIDRQKDQIFSYANNSARDRVKTSFILGRIAEKEGIKADPRETTQRVLALAEQYGIKPEKLVRQLQERDGIAEIEEQIISNKVLDFLEQNAQVEEVLPSVSPPAS